MNSPHSPLFWSIPAGSLFATRIRVSLYFPLLLLILILRLDAKLAIALTGIFLVSTLLHELIGHVLVARSTGGDGDEVLLWPFGGLAWVHPAPTFSSQFLTSAGGPFVNLLICLATLPTVLWIDGGGAAFNPFVLPIGEFSASWGPELLLLIFFVNWTLALVNLLPIYPLDGGRMVEACLWGRGTATERKTLCLKIGTVAAILVLALGLVLDNLWVVVLASMLLVLNILEGVNVQLGETYDDSFMGYDFSQGYTSLEKSSGSDRPARKSYWEKRKEKRQAERLKREQELRMQEEAQLDILLAKVHDGGIESLSPQERKFLTRASKNFRTKKE
ncbi:MAG: site-2 protease family protein [Rubinisphaera brasiliensis]|uniref:Peptidase M50 n=1 Tax=Rubinisphaera brasiliensis (strain ATCC 49424 / DSM 5305 / JCM 21570 / IAM 15109 / NBRC 103401 / IFAM 1448) TaxID=756272 RepID=F0SIH8_RUBBR|nr:site-2 protease family protein [Rubinisphaera brasiliensis]ADY59606.1 peptidase M50 [Rubinisphaera brasiliensis DSM 5305]